MTLNKQALREAAEKALNARERLELIESIFDDDGDITTEAQEDIKICTSFNDLTNPNTVLALLDELDRIDARNAELNSTIERWAPERAMNAEALEAAEKRIAELESREVELPKLKMLSDYLAEVTMREREDILVGVKLEFHRLLTAAGIKIKGE